MSDEHPSSTRRRKVRSRTIAPKRLSKGELSLVDKTAATMDEYEPERPRSRLDCLVEERPCPWVSCKHHLYLDVSEVGSVKLNFPDLEPWEMEDSCALDAADEGGLTLDRVGELLNITRERTRQIEVRALIAAGVAPDAAVGLGSAEPAAYEPEPDDD